MFMQFAQIHELSEQLLEFIYKRHMGLMEIQFSLIYFILTCGWSSRGMEGHFLLDTDI
jgi:hypothetical protein